MTQAGFFCASLESFDGCVSSLACTQITYIQSPEITATAEPDVLCENETLVLDGTNSAPGSGTVTYTWFDPAGNVLFTGTAPWAGPFPATDNSPQTGEYCLVVSDGGNCIDTACVNVTVNPVPQVVDNSIDGGGEYCAGDDGVVLSATVTISDNSDIDYVWTLNGNPIESGTVPSGTTLTLDLGTLELSDGGTYCLELTSDQGCEADPVCTTVTVNPTPQIISVTGGGTYCEGLDVPLNGTGTPGLGTVTYTWLDPDGNIVCTGTAPSSGPFPCNIVDITPGQAGLYTLILTLGDCTSEPATQLVEVNPKPLILNVSGGGEFCEGESTTITFTIDPNGAASVNWSISGPGLNESGTVTQVTTFTFPVTVNNASAGTYTITANSDAGCEATPQSVTITVKNIQPPVLTASPNPLCIGDELQLSTQPQQGAKYEWFKDGVSLGMTDDPVFDIPNPMPGNYTVKVTIDGCEATSAAVSVSLVAQPIANDDEFSATSVTPISGNVLTNDIVSGSFIITVVSGPSSGTVQIGNNGDFTYTPGSGAVSSDEFVYRICMVDCPDQCDEAIVRLTFVVECVVPNIITPNGDGVNDNLVVLCLENPDNFPNNRMRVFNRWGDEIAVFEPYRNDWDGTYGSDKKPVPAGTYFYLLQLDKNSGDKPMSGYIKVVR